MNSYFICRYRDFMMKKSLKIRKSQIKTIQGKIFHITFFVVNAKDNVTLVNFFLGRHFHQNNPSQISTPKAEMAFIPKTFNGKQHSWSWTYFEEIN